MPKVLLATTVTGSSQQAGIVNAHSAVLAHRRGFQAFWAGNEVLQEGGWPLRPLGSFKICCCNTAVNLWTLDACCKAACNVSREEWLGGLYYVVCSASMCVCQLLVELPCVQRYCRAVCLCDGCVCTTCIVYLAEGLWDVAAVWVLTAASAWHY